MKKLPVLILLMTLGAIVFADGSVEIKGYENADYTIYKNEAAMILNSIDNEPIGGITVGEMKNLAFDLSIPFQKMQYVKYSKIASAVIPGLGQFMNKDPLSGSLFLITDFAITWGTLLTAYHFLPEELKFDNLDYESSSVVKAAWDSQDFEDMLPSMGFFTAGVVVSIISRLISADNAGNLAQKNIADGTIRFEPRLILPGFDSANKYGMGADGFGIGMRLGF